MVTSMPTKIAQAKALIRQALFLLSDYPDADTPNPSRLLRLPEVMEITGMRKSTLYKMVNAGSFPQPNKMGPRMTVWPESTIRAWVQALASKKS